MNCHDTATKNAHTNEGDGEEVYSLSGEEKVSEKLHTEGGGGLSRCVHECCKTWKIELLPPLRSVKCGHL
jgi:hypothetical protein